MRSEGSIHNSVMHVADIMPTLLDIAQTKYPEFQDDRKLPPMIGKSWNNMLRGESDVVRNDVDYLAWELFGNRAIRQGDWKLIRQWKPFGTGDWELYNLNSDPGEQHDLSSGNSEKVHAMLKLWDDYVLENNVIIPNRSMYETMEDDMPRRFEAADGYPPLMYSKQYVPPSDMIKNDK